MAEKALIREESEHPPIVTSEDTLERVGRTLERPNTATEEGQLLTNSLPDHARRKPRVTLWLVAAVSVSMLGSGLPAGYCLGVINTPQEIIRAWVKVVILEKYGLELSATAEVSLWAIIVAIFVGGAAVGASCGAGLADRIGRRASFLVNHWLCICSALLLMACKTFGSVEMLIIGRFTSGLYSGLATCLVPLYLSEVVTADLRGVMGVTFPLGLCTGLLFSQILGMESALGTENGWPYLLGGYLVCVSIAVVLHPALPESPTYCYIILRDEVRGRKELCRLHRDNKYVEAEESSLRSLAVISGVAQEGKAWSLSQVIQSRRGKMLLLITVLFNAGQQFSGINAVFYYSTLIFRSVGLDLYQSQCASIGAGAINCMMAILAMPLIKYFHRRVLLLTSVALCSLCQIVLMVSLNLIPTSPCAPFVAIVALMSYVLVYGMGLGPVPYMIATELFPLGPRSIGIAVGGTSNWLCNLVVGLAFPLVQEVLGEWSFSIFIASSCLLFIFIYKFLPETHGKKEISLKQLSDEEEQESAEGTSTSSIEQGSSYSV
ncbi:solute carrier family 2, facilitated glucose transporter member 1 [Procambarus clarkii]|uniref:solute carrier family 2, facilitated glucose transporter member 1 n=1 Tax=Procambarus clarkii TaxID=6728 RepID=UPI003743624C